MSFFKWSRTAATNASADGSINWAEGMAPSAVNDSARAMMAAASKYRDDIAGAIATGGTSTAYTVTSYQVFDTLAHMDGAMIAFTPHATNGATVTLNVDGLGAKPLRSGPSVELPSNSLIVGTPYVATYYNSTAEWILQGGLSNPYSIPLASGIDYWGTTAPNSAFAFPYGQAISRTTYATLFTLIGTTYGTGDGSTTFNLPDKRGRISAPLDNLGGTTSAARLDSIASTTIGTAGGVQSASITATFLPVSSPWSASASTSVTVNAAGTHQHTASGWTTGFQNSKHTHTVGISSSSIQQGGGNAASVMVPGGSTTTSEDSVDHFHGGVGGTTDFAGSHDHTASASTSVTVGSNGSGGTAFNKLPPLIVCNYIMRVL